MDPYEVHKKIQEAIMALDVYQLTSSHPSSLWHAEIIRGLDVLSKLRQALGAMSNEKPQGNSPS